MAKSIISRQVEKISRERASMIDQAIFEVVPVWQIRLIRFIPLLRRVFGWEIITQNEFTSDNEIISIRRYGKEVCKLIFKVKYQEIAV